MHGPIAKIVFHSFRIVVVIAHSADRFSINQELENPQ